MELLPKIYEVTLRLQNRILFKPGSWVQLAFMNSFAPPCIQITPVRLTDSNEDIRAAISLSSIFHLPGLTIKDLNKHFLIDHLSKTLNWSNPIDLHGYSVDSEYKDLCAYFDYGDVISPINEVATKAFLKVSETPTWEHIRGNVIVFRLQPDYSFSPWIQYLPMISIEEMYRTMIFFRNSKESAYTQALKRDIALNMKRLYDVEHWN